MARMCSFTCRGASGLAAGIVLFASLARSVIAADDWTRFRGPNGSGIAATAFNDPITEKDFVWKIALPGVGHSSPVVRDGRVYLTCGEQASAKRIVLCLNVTDGKTIWKREFDSATYKQHNDNSYASASP